VCEGVDGLQTEKGVNTIQKLEQAQGKARTEIVEHVLEKKEECKLRDHGLPRWEGHLPSAHAKGLSDGVEEEDLSRERMDRVGEQTNENEQIGKLTAGPSTVK
jgi:hypothetical protein